MNPKAKKILQNIGGALLGFVIVSPMFFLSRPYRDFFTLVIYVMAAIYFYRGWKVDYYVNYGDLYKICLALVTLKSISFGLYYDKSPIYELFKIYNGLPHFILFTTISTAMVVLVFYGLYIWFWQKSKPKKNWAELTNAEALRQYVGYAKIWSEANNSSIDETEKSDKAFGFTWRAYLELKKRNRVDILEKLLNHKDRGVRVLAARGLLWTDEAEALWALDDMSQGHDEISKIAQSIFKDWKEGKIKPDPEI